MSLTAITARLTGEPIKFGGGQGRRVLITLKMIYEGGSLDGKTTNFPTRDVSRVVVDRSGMVRVMIASGDLAVECGWERLAEAQEEILWVCEAAHVPVIWA